MPMYKLGRTTQFLTFKGNKKFDSIVPYSLRPKGRSAKLYEYIQNNDILYADDLYKMSFNNLDKTLERYAKRHGISIIKTDGDTWEVQLIKK